MKHRKSLTKYAGLLAILTLVLLVGTACARVDANTAPNTGIYGFIYKFIALPLQNLMLWTAKQIGGQNGAGWGIVLITFIVRLVVMPLMLNQSFKSTDMQEKMQRIAPQTKLLQDSMKNSNLTKEQQMQLSLLQRELYQKNNISLASGIGCLPLLIQMPFMIGVYQAVQYSEQLRSATFLGINLASRSVILAVVGAAFGAIQGYISLIGLPESQKKAMQSTAYITPLLTLFISLSTSGALALYFLAGAVISVLQQLITTFWVMPKTKARIDRELAAHPVEEVITQERIAEILATNSNPMDEEAAKSSSHDKLRDLNAGKQNQPKQ